MKLGYKKYEKSVVVGLLALSSIGLGHSLHGTDFKCSHDLHEAHLVDQIISQTNEYSQVNRKLNSGLHSQMANVAQQRRRLFQNQESDHQPIRIHADYQLDGINQQLQGFVQDMIIPSTQTVLHNMISIKNGASNQQEKFFLPARCNETILVTQNGFPTGEESCARIQDMCGPHAKHNFDYFFGFTTCRGRDNCQDTSQGTGLSNTDFVLYVTAKQSDSCNTETSQVASAGMCTYDEESIYGLRNRPLAAFVNFCPNRLEELNTSNSLEVGYALDTAVHELIHGLFMGRELYQLYIDESGQQYNAVVYNGNGVPTQITSPKVVEAAQKIFGCESLQSVPLEDEGGDGTAGSHWEKAIFNRELMLGGQTIQERSIFSRMTLALAEDSGWYVANYTDARELMLGRDAGCEYLDVQQQCTQQPLPSNLQNAYCNSNEPQYQCTNNFQSVGTCPNEATGLTGNCRMLQKIVDLNCGAMLESPISASEFADFGQRFGRETRCLPVQGNEVQRVLDPKIFRKLNFGAACFRVRCLEDDLYFYIPPTLNTPGIELKCPSGQDVELSGVDLGFRFPYKVGPCPEADKVCKFWGCPFANGLACNGQGDCYQGQCQCYLGWKGPDCAQQICTIESCAGNEICNENTGDCIPNPAQLAESRILEDEQQISSQQRVSRVNVEGVAFDGYLKGCLVQQQPLDPDSFSEDIPFQFTDSFGRFDFRGIEGVPLILPYSENCTDVLSQYPPIMDLYAAPGTSVISPLSTLVFYMTETISDLNQASLQVKDGLGIPLAVDIHSERDLLRVLGKQESNEIGDRVAYSHSLALAITAQMLSAYLTLDHQPDVGNAFMKQIVETIIEQRLFSASNKQDIKQQINALLNQPGVADANFSPSDDQINSVSSAIAAYNQGLMQASRRQTTTSAQYLQEVVGIQRAAQSNASVVIASFRKGEISLQQFAPMFDERQIQITSSGLQPSQDELVLILGVSESGKDDTFWNRVSDWLRDTQWLDLPGWAWAIVFGVLAIILLGIVVSSLRLWIRQWSKGRRVERHRFNPN
eukprot:TRINITY_DN10411_c0_g2_i1.p1 TRINITY_DN10411_c0_g2~~TRINITY_DN10411_c0_g2_i1.p1  ORF type:complete len:1043 (-),score=97.76 TRINITY_DN10411_c0_g2_i1:683-3811(-)